MYLTGASGDMSAASDVLFDELSSVGLSIASDKTKVWCQDEQALTALDDSLRGKVVVELPVLGCHLFHHDRGDALAAGLGTGEQAMTKMAELAHSSANALKQAMDKGLPCQVAAAILRYVAVGAPQHLLRARRWSLQSLALYDTRVKEAWESILEMTLAEDQVLLGNLPMKEGGAAFGLSAPRAAVAFLTGWRREFWAVSGGTPIHSVGVLQEQYPGLVGDIQAATADIHTIAPNLRGDARLDFTVQPAKRLQHELVNEVMDAIKGGLLPKMSEPQRAQVRRGGGPGAGGFLLVPLPGIKVMANGPWRMALRRWLLCSAAQVVAPQVAETRCLHSGRRGVCGAQLEGQTGLVHAIGCKTGGGIVDEHN